MTTFFDLHLASGQTVRHELDRSWVQELITDLIVKGCTIVACEDTDAYLYCYSNVVGITEVRDETGKGE